ncbi:tetratricopeptide repeat protein [Rummeliibacillus suwonensis]|uniref:tetratricopeptide repeat protein n=1 Tax=Rummeliibacillus suwonensis TaxID=1306154 RepID=UPI00289F6343|nr:tetratricopeptide repeat protein [Rummeliibacillus suwonensis]
MDIQEKMIDTIQKGNLEGIQNLLEDFKIQADPSIQYEVIGLLTNFGFLEEADELLEHLLYLFPDEAQLKIDRATLLMEREQEDEALNLLMSIDNAAPEYPQVLLALADYYQMQGLYEVSEQRIDEALDLLPDEPLLHFAKAELLMEMGRFTEAARIYHELYEEQTEIAGVRLVERLAEVHRAGAAFEEALTFYMKALEDNTSPDLLFGAAYSAFQSQMYETAIRYTEDLKTLDPDYFSAYLLLAQSYAMLENNQQALVVIKEGITRDEYDKELYLFAGKMALKNSLPEEAEQYLRQAIALDSEYMEAIITLVSILSKEERDEEIVELIEKLEQESFDWSTLSAFAAISYDRLENYERAYDFYQLAYNDHKEDPLFLEKYVYFLIEDGKRAEAKDVVKQLIALQPEEPTWQDLLQTFE